MALILSNRGTPLKFQRRRFPIMVYFAMTINKSQGQYLSYVELFLPKSIFTYGQLFVFISIVKSKKGLKVLILEENENVTSSQL